MTTPPDDRTEALGAARHPAVAAGRPPVERVGPWRLLKGIGSGGMGEVYLGERADGSYEAQVAVKLLRVDRSDALALERLRAERRILAGLEHPNIARLIDGGELPSGLPWLVMEYVDGEPIDSWCAKRQLGLEARIDLLLKICDALAHAHRRLVVHRDLKPSNIMVNAAGEPKLLDFGIAKLLAEREGEPLATAGLMLTPAYASPEQVMGEAVGTATDVYQLGLLAYELLSGVRVQAKASTTRPAELKAVIVDQAPRRPSEAAARQPGAPVRPARLRGDLDTIVLKAIRKEPARRYGSVEELASDLRCYLQRRPISARPDSLLYRSQRFVQRNRAAVAVAVAVLALLAWGFVQERQLRGEAEHARDLAQQAALAAEAAQQQSELERARAKEVLGFIEATLARASPNELGIDLKVVELLDDAAERLRALEDPAVRASLYDSLARTQKALGRPRVAEALLREAIAVSEGQLPARDPLQITLRQSLLNVLLQLDEYSEIEPVAGALIELLEATRGRHDSAVLQARSRLIEAVQVRGEPDAALAMLDALIAEVEPELGLGPDLAALVHFRARMLLNMRRYDDSIAAFHRERAVREAYPSDNPRPLLNAIGMPLLVALSSARYDTVLAGVDDFQRLVVEVLGEDTPSLTNSDNMRLVSLWKTGEFEQAVAFGRRALPDAERRLGPDNPFVLTLRSNFAQALGESGRHQESLELLSAARAGREAVLGMDAPSALLAIGYEAVQVAALGRHAEALAMVRDARSRMRDEHVLELWASMPGQLDLAEARILRVSGDLDAAVIMARAAFEALTARLGDEDMLSTDAARELTRTLELRGEHEAAAAIHARFPRLARTPPPLP